MDASGEVVWEAAYLPFGGAQIVTETVANNFRFPGQYFDAETGLHYNWHRYYDPKTGRYLTPDPIGLAGGVNLYGYALGNPVNNFDPTGLAADILADVGFIVWDVYQIAVSDPCEREDHLKALGLDILGAVLPGATGLGVAYMAGQKGLMTVAKLTRSQAKRIGKIKEIAHNWEARKTLSGEILDEGHIKKIRDGMAGLTKHRQALQNSLDNPKLDSAARSVIQESIDKATDLIDRGSQLIK